MGATNEWDRCSVVASVQTRSMLTRKVKSRKYTTCSSSSNAHAHTHARTHGSCVVVSFGQVKFHPEPSIESGLLARGEYRRPSRPQLSSPRAVVASNLVEYKKKVPMLIINLCIAHPHSWSNSCMFELRIIPLNTKESANAHYKLCVLHIHPHSWLNSCTAQSLFQRIFFKLSVH
jgi:hypothetical protein